MPDNHVDLSDAAVPLSRVTARLLTPEEQARIEDYLVRNPLDRAQLDQDLWNEKHA